MPWVIWEVGTPGLWDAQAGSGGGGGVFDFSPLHVTPEAGSVSVPSWASQA